MGTTKHCYIQNIEALGLLVSEKKIFVSFSHCKSMETIYPRGVAKFDPRGMAGTIYVEAGTIYALAIATYKISKLCALWFQRRRFLIFFPYSKSIETINLRGLAKFDPRGMNGTIYVEDH